MTTKLARVSLALFVLLGATTFAPPAQALPPYEIHKQFWHCDNTPIGWRWQTCAGVIYSNGAQSGYYMMVTNTWCDGSGRQTRTLYRCESGTCTVISAIPGDPAC